MLIKTELKNYLEEEEIRTVSDSFGGIKAKGKTLSYSITDVRNKVVLLLNENQEEDELKLKLNKIKKNLKNDKEIKLFKNLIENAIRFSFLIELTNLSIGSTKMKTRWLKGKIMKSQENSFEPIEGDFYPGQDQRASEYEECLNIFIKIIDILIEKTKDPKIKEILLSLSEYNSVPYEFVFSYINAENNPVHVTENVQWALNEDIQWLVKARKILKDNETFDKKKFDKIKTKAYKTDRALTGKDKTNRARRWEVLWGDFQYATIEECWEVEKKLIESIVLFDNFPPIVKEKFIYNELISKDKENTKCPITLKSLDYNDFKKEITHGISDYQVGHKKPLKIGGKHNGENTCWQSADGNRMQGDLTIDETINIILEIAEKHLKMKK